MWWGLEHLGLFKLLLFLRSRVLLIKTKISVITKFNPTSADEKTVVNMKHDLGTQSHMFRSLAKACFQAFVLENAAGPAGKAQGLISCQRELLLSSCGHPFGLLQPRGGREASMPWVNTKVKISGRKNKTTSPPEEKSHLTVETHLFALSLSAHSSFRSWFKLVWFSFPEGAYTTSFSHFVIVVSREHMLLMLT